MKTQEELRELLEKKFDSSLYRTREAFLYTGLAGTDGQRYGSFKTVKEKDLEGRTYRLEYWDGAVSIFWTDVLHDPRTRKNVPIES